MSEAAVQGNTDLRWVAGESLGKNGQKDRVRIVLYVGPHQAPKSPRWAVYGNRPTGESLQSAGDKIKTAEEVFPLHDRLAAMSAVHRDEPVRDCDGRPVKRMFDKPR